MIIVLCVSFPRGTEREGNGCLAIPRGTLGCETHGTGSAFSRNFHHIPDARILQCIVDSSAWTLQQWNTHIRQQDPFLPWQLKTPPPLHTSQTGTPFFRVFCHHLIAIIDRSLRSYLHTRTPYMQYATTIYQNIHRTKENAKLFHVPSYWGPTFMA